jgi:hypothetical protein
MKSVTETQRREYAEYRNNTAHVQDFAKFLVEHGKYKNDRSEYPDHKIYSLATMLKPLLENCKFGVT